MLETYEAFARYLIPDMAQAEYVYEPASEIRSPSCRRKDRIGKSVFKSEKG